MRDSGSDPLDQASDLEASLREAYIQEVQRRMVEFDPDFDGKHCVECAAVMPQLRLTMGRIRCVYCQEEKERKSKHFGVKF